MSDVGGPIGEMTEAERSLLRTFVASRRWQFASTMPENPHWYTVRKWCPEGEADFEDFVRIVRRYGDDEVFEGRTYRYLDFEGFHYWTMGAPVSETTVINRKPLPVDGGCPKPNWGMRVMFEEIPSDRLRPEHLPPPDAGWADIAPFALTFEGYEHVRSRWPDRHHSEACRVLAEEIRAAVADSDGDPTEYSLDDLRAALFWWQRVAHWSGGIAIGGKAISIDPKILDHCRRLVEYIRQRVEAGTEQ